MNRSAGLFQRWAICALLLCAIAAIAARAAEEEADAQPTAAAAERDPFWPVGYQKRTAIEPEPQISSHTPMPPERRAGLQINNLSPEQQAALSRQMRVSGIMKARNGYTAYLNGRLVEPGDDITVDFDGQKLTLTVKSVGADSVQIEPKINP